MAALREHAGALAFSGLRRALGAHPESLTRALRRLERWGRVARDGAGYRLSDDEEEGPPAELELPAGLSPATGADRIPLAEVLLAPGVDATRLMGHLAGRWTGSLRWVGVYDRAREPLLAWSRADGPGQLLLGVRNGRLRVYAEHPPGDPVPPGLHEAAQELLVFALGRLRHLVVEPSTGRAPAFHLGERRPFFGSN